MDDVTLAEPLTFFLLIGGVAFVTTYLSVVRDLQAPAERVVFFETAEQQFSQ